MQSYTTSILEKKNKRGRRAEWGPGGWEAGACTPPGV